MEAVETSTARPGTKIIRVGPDGEAWIEGFRCPACNAVMTVQTMACRSCGGRDLPAPYRSPETGKLFSWSIVHRSYPGVEVPFVSAIVDLDGGMTIKGTLRGVQTDELKSGLPVQLVFDDAGGAVDQSGAPYIGFHFVPQEDAA